MISILSPLQRLPENTRELVKFALWGIAAGLGAVLFQLAMLLLFTHTIEAFSSHGLARFAIESLAMIIATSLAAGLLMTKYSREASGSGVPQLKLAYWKDLGYVPLKAVLVKFAAGVLSIGGGTSLGREGPSVFLAGGLASALGGRMGLMKRRRRAAASAGAAAGLAAAFNTPLAAITFVLEEIIGSIHTRNLGGIVFASVCGAFTVFALIGKQPAFALPEIAWPSSWSYTLLVPVALLASVAGALFQRFTIMMRGRVRRISRLPKWVQPAIGAAATWCLAMTVFVLTRRTGVFGLGYGDLSDALLNNMAWHTAGLLLLAKLAATIFSYSWGGCGGIFSPLLFLGGMCGFFIGGLFDPLVPQTSADHVVLAVAGMSACFGAAVRAPLTSILMLFEMTHQFTMVPALMISVLISQVVGRTMNRVNFYDAILEQDGHNLFRIIPPKNLQAWHGFPVASLINPKPVLITDLSEKNLRAILDSCNYKRFPVVIDGEIRGILARKTAEAALKQGIAPELIAAPFCAIDDSIGNIANAFMTATIGMLIVKNNDGSIAGLLTLHDLLRAEASMADSD